MTRNKRYEAYYDARQEERRQLAESRPRPISVPQGAYGPQRLERPAMHPTVWAWVPWTDGDVVRVEAIAEAWNDKVVLVSFYGPGGRVQVSVWRQAVTNRVADVDALMRQIPLPDGFTLATGYDQAPRIRAPHGAILEVRNVWTKTAWTGYSLADYPDEDALMRGTPSATGAGAGFAEARHDVERWIAAAVGRTMRR
jgi:hypothetical protein